MTALTYPRSTPPHLIAADRLASFVAFSQSASLSATRRSGSTVYYLVPTETTKLDDLCHYLNSSDVAAFPQANCQRAANGLIRLQSHILKRIPLPAHLATSLQLAWA